MRIAIAQTPGTSLDQWPQTLALVGELIGQAAGLGAELVVLPECAWPAYILGSRQAYFAARDTGLPGSDAFLARLSDLARHNRIAACAGYVEETGDRLSNAACLVDARGRLLGVHRKCFLWDFDHDYFEPGSDIAPIETPWGRAGLMICADARLPEIPAALAARGANLILQPTGWVNAGSPGELWNPQPDFLIAARAEEFGLPIASASKWGREGATTFVGSSLICDAVGHPVVQCKPAETAVVCADVDPQPPRRPQLSEAQRAVLLSRSEPLAPTAEVAPLEVLLLPAAAGETTVAELAAAAAASGRNTLLLVHPSCQGLAREPAQVLGPRCALRGGPCGEPIDLGGARIAAHAGSEACGFGAIRCTALSGVHLAVVFGGEASMLQLKSRACENRLFVGAVGGAGLTVSGPDGRCEWSARWPTQQPGAHALTLPLAAAANKLLVGRTDCLGNRARVGGLMQAL